MPKPQEGQELIKPKTDFSNLILPGILVALVLVIIITAMNYNNLTNNNQQDSDTTSQSQDFSSVEELIIEDLKVGEGRELESGDVATFHYVGTLLSNGIKFDSSRDREQPFTIEIGSGMVIQGWDQGLPGMKIGGIRKLTIPYSLAYGEQGSGGIIPPRADLVFEVELLDIE